MIVLDVLVLDTGLPLVLFITWPPFWLVPTYFLTPAIQIDATTSVMFCGV
jgi:hypothetical protein